MEIEGAGEEGAGADVTAGKEATASPVDAVDATASPPPANAQTAGPVTRSRTGVFCPSSRYADDYVCTASTYAPSPLPSSVRAALRGPL